MKNMYKLRVILVFCDIVSRFFFDPEPLLIGRMSISSLYEKS